MVADHVALDNVLAAAEILWLFVKGPTLTKLALAIKAKHNINILIAPYDLEAAFAVIEARRFRMIVPTKVHARVAAWHRLR